MKKYFNYVPTYEEKKMYVKLFQLCRSWSWIRLINFTYPDPYLLIWNLQKTG